MSIENIEKFYAMAFKNPSMVEGLKTDGDPERFATLAVELGAANGCIFTTEEVGEWTKVKAAALQKNELDDQQLEAVAGGKIGNQPRSSSGSQLHHMHWTLDYSKNTLDNLKIASEKIQ